MGMNGLIADSDLRIAVLVPCYNEESALLPALCAIFAMRSRRDDLCYYNNSRDRTIEVARAIRQRKGVASSNHSGRTRAALLGTFPRI